jgi:hypothetical protein
MVALLSTINIIEYRTFAFVFATLLCGCVAHQPSLLKGTQGVIPGNDTAGLAPDFARLKVLREADGGAARFSYSW